MNTLAVTPIWSGIPDPREANGFLFETAEELTASNVVVLVYVREPSTVNKIKIGYSKFPIISATIHAIGLLSILGLVSFAFWGFQPVHPYIFFWLTIASLGMASVVWTAAEEFDGGER